MERRRLVCFVARMFRPNGEKQCEHLAAEQGFEARTNREFATGETITVFVMALSLKRDDWR
jgi:hypothetical protein